MRKHKRPTNLLSLSDKKSFQQRRRRRKKWSKMKMYLHFLIILSFLKSFSTQFARPWLWKGFNWNEKNFQFHSIAIFLNGPCPARCWDSNPQPSEQEPPPMTTWFILPPIYFWCNKVYHTVHQLFIRSRGSMYLTYLRISLLQQKYHSMLGSRCLPAVS